MKAILEFLLPDEKDEYDLAINGSKYAIIWEDLQEWLRQKYKYDNKTTLKIEDIRKKMCELYEDRFRDT